MPRQSFPDGYAFESSRRYPKAPEISIVSADDYDKISPVGFHTIDGTLCRAWRCYSRNGGFGGSKRTRYVFAVAFGAETESE